MSITNLFYSTILVCTIRHRTRQRTVNRRDESLDGDSKEVQLQLEAEVVKTTALPQISDSASEPERLIISIRLDDIGAQSPDGEGEDERAPLLEAKASEKSKRSRRYRVKSGKESHKEDRKERRKGSSSSKEEKKRVAKKRKRRKVEDTEIDNKRSSVKETSNETGQK